jgi:hypothetical protein
MGSEEEGLQPVVTTDVRSKVKRRGAFWSIFFPFSPDYSCPLSRVLIKPCFFFFQKQKTRARTIALFAIPLDLGPVFRPGQNGLSLLYVRSRVWELRR